MPNRSQRHLRERQGYDSSGWFITPPPQSISPDSATIAAAGAAGRVICTFSTVGGVAPITYSVVNAGGVACAISGNQLLTTADPAGTAGLKGLVIMATDARGLNKSESLAVTLT